MTIVHGKTSISVEGGIILVRASGSFNLHGIEKAIKELQWVIESFGNKKIKLLLNYTEIEGATPDVFEKINECNVWLNSHTMLSKAVIISSAANLYILESRTPARQSQNSKNFDDEASAITWLNAQN